MHDAPAQRPVPAAGRPARSGLRPGGTRRLGHLRHHPSLFWLLAASAALVAGLSTEQLLATQAELRARWGPIASVPVAKTDLPVGTTIESGQVLLKDLPRLMVPDDLATEPVGQVVVEPILEGEPIVGDRLAGEGSTGMEALVPSGGAAIAIPRVQPLPPVEVGDRVDVLASSLTGLTGTSEVVARSARVVSVTEEAVTVAVQGDETLEVGYAAGQGLATVVLQGPPVAPEAG